MNPNEQAKSLIETWASQISTSMPGELWQLESSLARALAACALEARLEETKRLRKVIAAAQSVDEFYVFFDTTIPTSANGARIAIQILRDELRALERAAGEKS